MSPRPEVVKMQIDLSQPNPAFSSLLTTPTELIAVDANFFLPPDRTNLKARTAYSFEQFRDIWIAPLHQLLPNLAIHEAVLAELVDERPHQFAQALIESGIPPQLKLLRDSDLSPIEQAMRQTMELQIAPFTNFDPSRNNKDDRGEVKTLAHMAVKGYTFFVTNDANALRLIERADQLGTSLDALKTLHFYEGIYLLFRNGAMQLADAKNLYRYLYYMTKRERDGNPAWGDFCGGMDKLYASIS